MLSSDMAAGDSDYLGSDNETLKSPCSPSPPLAQKVAELWYEDEDLAIFQAEDKIFQVPETLFSRKSNIFFEFLQNPTQPSEYFQWEDSMYSGNGHCVYTLLGVTAKEAQYFLTALYDAEYFDLPPAQCTIEMAISILKLSTRYEVQFLRCKALAHLESGYPMKLKAWDNRIKNSTFPLENRDFGRNIMMKSITLHETLSVIEVAKSCNAQWLLPAASYELGMHSTHSLVNDPRWRKLEKDLKAQLEIGRSLQAVGFRKILSFLNIPGLTKKTNMCSNPNDYTCLEARRKTRQKLDEEQWENHDPLHIWDEEDWEAYPVFQESCDACIQICQSKHERDRQYFWTELPRIYGWPSWDTLMALQVIAT